MKLDDLVEFTLSKSRIFAFGTCFIVSAGCFALTSSFFALLISFLFGSDFGKYILPILYGAIPVGVSCGVIASIAYGPVYIIRPISKRPDVVTESSSSLIHVRYE